MDINSQLADGGLAHDMGDRIFALEISRDRSRFNYLMLREVFFLNSANGRDRYGFIICFSYLVSELNTEIIISIICSFVRS